MPVRTNLHSLLLGATIAGALSVVLVQIGIGRPSRVAGLDLPLAASIAALELVLFGLGHLALRRRDGSALAYALLGAAAFGGATALGFAGAGHGMIAGLPAATVGLLTGSLYRLHAIHAGRPWRHVRAEMFGRSAAKA